MVYIGIKAREKFNDKHKFAMVNRIFEEVLEEFYLSSLLFAPKEGIISQSLIQSHAMLKKVSYFSFASVNFLYSFQVQKQSKIICFYLFVRRCHGTIHLSQLSFISFSLLQKGYKYIYCRLNLKPEVGSLFVQFYSAKARCFANMLISQTRDMYIDVNQTAMELQQKLFT